jgi:glycogen debranching enzyme
MARDPRKILKAAQRVLDDAVMCFEGRPVGTVAARPPGAPAAENYEECFVRDFAVSALVYLADGKLDIVRNFLETVLRLREQEIQIAGHDIQPGVMPASFRVERDPGGSERLLADFGQRAIGRVAPVDSMMWWMIVLHAYVQASGDRELAAREDFQGVMQEILELCLSGSFECLPTLLVPDGSGMIDRRLGVYGHPLEIQALFYAMLHTAGDLFGSGPQARGLGERARQRQDALRDYIRTHYWMDLARLNEMHRFHTEEFGSDTANRLNIYPESLPDWLEHWVPEQGGYLVGNLGPGRIDVRFFALGNLLAVLFGLASEQQTQDVMDLYEARWSDLVGAMPVKICYPALEGELWRAITGSDPKNRPWSYHNGGNWPVLLWPFVAAALKAERRDLANNACALAAAKVLQHDWPEYYDGRTGRLIGQRANLNQTWSAAAFLLAYKLLDDPELLAMFPGQVILQAG